MVEWGVGNSNVSIFLSGCVQFVFLTSRISTMVKDLGHSNSFIVMILGGIHFNERSKMCCCMAGGFFHSLIYKKDH